MFDRDSGGATRRTVLAAGLAGLLSGSIRAAAPVLAVPTADRLTLQVVDDAATFGPFLPDLQLPGMTVRRAGHGGSPAPRMGARTLLGEFGLSNLATSRCGAATRRVLVDFGYSREAMANNLALLGIAPDSIDAAVLSHGHLDHYGGFASLFGERAARPGRLPLYVGGEETFCECVAIIGAPPPVMGALDRAALTRAGYDVRIAAAPAIVAAQAFTTGTIPLYSFERAAIPTQMRPGVGCARAGLAAAKRAATQLADDGEHELATCYAVRDLGLVVIASSSHRGVINSVRRAQAVSGVAKVHAVLGGFHLVRPRTPEEATRTLAAFAELDPTYIVPMNCRGEAFIAEATRVMPQKPVRAYVGTSFVFESEAA